MLSLHNNLFKMIYLIGVSNHNIQHNENGCADLDLRNNFSAFLKNKIREYNINLLAEEFNKNCFRNPNKSISTAQKVAKNLENEGLKIEHRFCEMDRNEQERRGILRESQCLSKIDKEKSFLARETFWFEKISDYFDKNILFLCGPEHIESFLLLLNSKQYKATILCKQYSQKF